MSEKPWLWQPDSTNPALLGKASLFISAFVQRVNHRVNLFTAGLSKRRWYDLGLWSGLKDLTHSSTLEALHPQAKQNFPKNFQNSPPAPVPLTHTTFHLFLFSLPVKLLEKKSPTSFPPLSLFSLFSSLHLYTDTTFVVFPIDLRVKSSGQFTVCIFVHLVATFDTIVSPLNTFSFISFPPDSPGVHSHLLDSFWVSFRGIS